MIATMSSAPIVTGTDGSESAERAVERAAELAEALGAPVHVVSSYSGAQRGVWMAAAGGMAIGELASDDEARLHAQHALARVHSRVCARGISCSTHLASGDPAQALLTIAEDEGAQMIVVGSRGMSGARRVLGSVPNSVSHHARCCVVIVPTS